MVEVSRKETEERQVKSLKRTPKKRINEEKRVPEAGLFWSIYVRSEPDQKAMNPFI